MGRLQAHAEGVIEATNINGATVVSSMHYNYPLKFISVNNHTKTHSTAWLYEINYGGGLVSGDEVTINMTLNDSCSAVLSGQSSMKIYKSKQDGANSGASAHHLAANVGKDSLLCIAYPAVTCFAGAEYDQTQIVKLEDETSNVIIVEWTTSGRVALGESWDFAMLQTKNEIWLSGELLIKEAVRLSDADSPLTVKERMHPFTSMATIVLVGPRVLPYARCIHEEIGKMQIGGMGAKQQNTLVCSSSALKYRKKPGDEEATVGFIIKVAAHTNSQVNEFIHEMLENTWTDLLGDDPYK